MYRLTLKTAPTSEPIALDEAKEYLRLDIDSEDSYVYGLIVAARKFCENYQNRAYITQTWELSMDDFCEDIVDIPKGKLQSISSIVYTDSDSVATTLSSTKYVYSTRGTLGRLTPAYGETWPTFVPYPLDAVVITFICGYGTAEDVPETIKQAMYLLISHWYENRVPLADKMTVPDELSFTVSALLWIERIVIL